MSIICEEDNDISHYQKNYRKDSSMRINKLNFFVHQMKFEIFLINYDAQACRIWDILSLNGNSWQIFPNDGNWYVPIIIPHDISMGQCR